MSLSKKLGINENLQPNSYPNLGGGLSSITVEQETIDASAIKKDAIDLLISSLGQEIYTGDIAPETLEVEVYEAVAKVIIQGNYSLTSMDRANLVQNLMDEILGLGPLEPLLRDPSITEIMVNGFQNIFIERKGKLTKSSYTFTSEEHLRKTIERIVSQVGRRIDESSPMVDARLANGTRVNAVVPPIALDGSSLTLRKFSVDPFTIKDLVSSGTVTPEAMEVLKSAIQGKLNIVISGGTGSGKTTTLNVLASMIDRNERIVTIEDAAELNLGQPHVLRMESRPPNSEGKGQVTIRDLVRNSLRMRPDRIIVGEVRDGAALDMLQAMSTGHEGSLTTVHANTARDALMRIETMVLMAGMDLPVNVIRDQIVGAIDLVIQQSRMRDGSRRITQICEVVGIDSNVIQLQDIFTFQEDMNDVNSIGRLVSSGLHLTKFRSGNHGA
ncbi:MAG: CpaF family protein [Candidatus Nanopelagicaceae bacterium]